MERISAVAGGDAGRVADEARAVPGVEAVGTRVQAEVPVTVGDTNFPGRVVGLPVQREPAVNRVELERGRYLEPARRDGVLVEKHMATSSTSAPATACKSLVKRSMAGSGPLDATNNVVAANLLRGPHPRWLQHRAKQPDCRCNDPLYQQVHQARWPT